MLRAQQAFYGSRKNAKYLTGFCSQTLKTSENSFLAHMQTTYPVSAPYFVIF